MPMNIKKLCIKVYGDPSSESEKRFGGQETYHVKSIEQLRQRHHDMFNG